MNKFIKYWTLVLLIVISIKANAQQEPQYTQFMYNKLPLNAAYTGARDVVSIRALYRNQWTGIKGAPQTATLSVHSPLKNENIALGTYIVNDRLGVTNQTWVDASFAYRIKIKEKMRLAFGINAGILWYKSNLHDLTLNQSNDPNIANVSRVLPDVGAGIYFNHPNFYLGLSIPNFIKMDLYNKSTMSQIEQIYGSSKVKFARRTPHFFMMAGGVIPCDKNKKFMIRPQIMGKYIVDRNQKIPFEMDFNLSFLIMNRVNIGGTYRTAFHHKKTDLTNYDSFDANIEVWPLQQLMIGYAYDYTLTKLGDYNKGSHEIIIGYDLVMNKKKLNTPRYF